MPDTFDSFMPDQSSAPAQASAGSFDSFMPQQEAPQTQVPQQQQPMSTLQAAPGAVLGGVANAAASGYEAGIDATLWAGTKLGILDPKTVEQAKQLANQDITKTFRSGNYAGAPQDSLTQAVNTDPNLSATTKYGTGIGLLAATTPARLASSIPELEATAPALTKALNYGGLVGGNSVISAGLAGQGGQPISSQDKMAEVGAALSAVSPVASKIVTAAANKAIPLAQRFANYISGFDKEPPLEHQALALDTANTTKVLKQDSNNFQQIKQIPGTINSQPVINAAQNIISNSKVSLEGEGEQLNSLGSTKANTSTLSQPQLTALLGIQKQAANLQNMDQALKLKTQISANYKLFSGKGVPDDIKASYDTLKNQVDTAIKSKAYGAGLEDQYETANAFHSKAVIPLYKDGADKRLAAFQEEQKRIAFNQKNPGQYAAQSPAYQQALKKMFPANMSPDQLNNRLNNWGPQGRQVAEKYFVKQALGDIANPENLNKNESLMNLNRVTDKYSKVLSPESLQELNGVKNVLKAAGAEAKTQSTESNTYMYHYLGAAIGGGLGYHEEGNTAGAVGGAIAGAAGLALMPNVIKQGSALVDNPAGRAMLRKLADDPTAAKKLVNTLIQAIPAQSSSGEGN